MAMYRATLICIALCVAATAGQTISGPAAGPEQLSNTAFSADNAPLVANNDWREGRATFYDAPTYFADAYAPRSFGSILYGDCQYYSRGLGEQNVTYADQFFPEDMVAALATADPDYPGSCGRCYEVQCRDGLVIQNGTNPALQSTGFNLQTIAPNTKDTEGRSFPGNPAAAQNENFVKCWNDTSSIYVAVVDSCPCATNQQWCCGPVQHFDLSFWAFEKLAHPLYGTMMLNFRPVDCDTKQPFTNFVPGAVNETIYGNRVETGWSFNVYDSDAQQFALPGAGIGGSNATCLAPRAGGGVTFTARNGSDSGYQPFGTASQISFYIRNNGTTSTGVPAGLKFTLQNTEQKLYCGGNVIPGQSIQPTSTDGEYSYFVVPIAQFGCTGNPSLAQVDALGIQNTGTTDLNFCLDEIVIAQAANAATTGRKMKM